MDLFSDHTVDLFDAHNSVWTSKRPTKHEAGIGLSSVLAISGGTAGTTTLSGWFAELSQFGECFFKISGVQEKDTSLILTAVSQSINSLFQTS